MQYWLTLWRACARAASPSPRIGSPASAPHGATALDAGGAHLAPGIVELGVFSVDKAACIAGGITRVALMPDLSPPLDDPGLVQRSALAAKPDLWVHPLAAATRRLEGRELCDLNCLFFISDRVKNWLVG